MKAIIACDSAGGIGYKGKLPWVRLEGDLDRFKKLTLGGTVIMGRATWDAEGMPKPLPGRTNVVITSTPIDVPGVLTYTSIKDVPNYEDAWLIGGAKLIYSNMDLITELHLSKTYDIYECDRFIELQYFRLNFDVGDFDMFPGYNYSIWRRNATVS